MKLVLSATCSICLFVLAACGGEPPDIDVDMGGDAGGASASNAGMAVLRLPFPGTRAGAKRLAEQFLIKGTDTRMLTLALKPDKEDYSSVFTEKNLAKIEERCNRLWSDMPPFSAGEGQTEALVFAATTEELAAAKVGTEAYEYPGGMTGMAKDGTFQPGVTFYMIKFIKPGETRGTRYTGLVYVNGHWSIFPSPWRALR